MPAADSPDLRAKVLSFKVTDLQQCAVALGLPRYGRKADLQSRILGYLEELRPPTCRAHVPPATVELTKKARQVINDVYRAYRKTQNQSFPTNSSFGSGASLSPGSTSDPFPGSDRRAAPIEKKVRCLCQGMQIRPNMVQCQDPTCGIWQHAECVGRETSASDAGGANEHYCELCRVHLADPFWQPIETLLPPAKLKPAVGRPPLQDNQGKLLPHQGAERAFFLGDPQLAGPRSTPASLRVQLGCLLLEDSVLLRHHWPRNVALRVNCMHYRPYGRNPSTKMGINQRDDAASIATLCLRGRNAIDIQAMDVGTWILVLQRTQKRTLDEVKALMAAEETLEEAVERVKRLVGSGGAAAGEGDDDAIAVSHQVVTLKDPLSGVRMKVPARFSDVSGLQAFDLDSFLHIVERNRKWQDPTTLRNSNVRRLKTDSYIKRVVACVAQRPDVSVIEIDETAKWRPEGNDDGEWFDIFTDIDAVRAKLAEGHANHQHGTATVASKEKKHGKNAKRAAEGPPASESGSETDEEEELRRAAAAVRGTSAVPSIGSKKPPPVEPEVIELLDSSDDDDIAAQQSGLNSFVAPATRPGPASGSGQPLSQAGGGGPLPLGPRRSVAGQARAAATIQRAGPVPARSQQGVTLPEYASVSTNDNTTTNNNGMHAYAPAPAYPIPGMIPPQNHAMMAPTAPYTYDIYPSPPQNAYSTHSHCHGVMRDPGRGFEGYTGHGFAHTHYANQPTTAALPPPPPCIDQVNVDDWLL